MSKIYFPCLNFFIYLGNLAFKTKKYVQKDEKVPLRFTKKVFSDI